MFFSQPKFGSEFLSACFILLNILRSSTAQTGQDPSSIPSISNSVATHICKQQSAFQESGEIQTPVTAKPENDDSACGWYLWQKCEESKSESGSESCPTFVIEACEQISTQGKTGRKGKGISQKPAESRREEDKCANSSVQGLPNPQIVASSNKYPSVVTIEKGDRCQTKFCTGLILNEFWILTQQTGCMYQFLPQHSDYFSIVAGERRMFVEEGTEQRRSVAEFIPHPGLKVEDNHHYKDNIGLTRLSEPLEFNENVQPIDLAAIETIAPSIEKLPLTIVGWLLAQPMKEDQEMLASFIESPLDFVPIDECYDKLMEGDNATRESLICAGRCVVQGDQKNQPRRNILYAQENAEPGSDPVPVGLGPVRHKSGNPQHGVFVNIASYIPWIKETMEGQGQGQDQSQDETTESPDDPESESRVIRGEDVPPYKYKSMVNLELHSSYECTRHLCGGSILSEEWFLTAAHCVENSEASDLKVIVAEHDISDSDENEQIVSVAKIIIHENYDSLPTLNDIAVLKVTPPFTFNDKVQKVTLPESSFEPPGPLTAIGWGLTEKIMRPHILKHVEIPLVPLDDCIKYYEDWPKHPTTTNICVGNETHGVCYGDSGGPLYHIDESGDQVVVGIVSYGGSMCRSNLKTYYDPDYRGANTQAARKEFTPNIFTRVASYVDWIRKNAEMDN